MATRKRKVDVADCLPTGQMPAMTSPTEHPDAPSQYRARVRMYRHGLGDCFLLTIPRASNKPFQILIDCGALARKKDFMSRVVTHIRDTVRGEGQGKARLDVVVGTHEHKDHLSGFNQARAIWNDEFEFGAVWLAWTENLTQAEVRKIKATKKRVASKLRELALSPRLGADGARFEALTRLASFSSDDDSTDERTVEDALRYLKARGEAACDLRYLEPGQSLAPRGLKDVNVHVLGPPTDPRWIKTSSVTEQMKRDHVVYHLDARAEVALDALTATLDPENIHEESGGHPFAPEHRIRATSRNTNTQLHAIRTFLDATYDHPDSAWRRIDTDWAGAFEQLALDLDNDTNNSSLVLAFEFGVPGDVLLFVADAQIGSWLSWKEVTFKRGRRQALTSKELLSRTKFYKVGHHCSHNATAQSEGLEWMTAPGVVAFIPLDEETARNAGKHGWEMPAPALYRALERVTEGRVVISDTTKPLPPEAHAAGVRATTDYVDFYLK
jgi:hypothetical protein